MKSIKYIALVLIMSVSQVSFSQNGNWDKKVREIYKTLDKDGDGVLTHGEIKKHNLLRIVTFPILDKNQSKKIEFKEFHRSYSNRKALKQAHRESMALNMSHANTRFKKLDKNSDGKLIKPELLGQHIYTLFNRIDIDKNGEITNPEFRAEHALWVMTAKHKKALRAGNSLNSNYNSNKVVANRKPAKKYVPKKWFKYEELSAEALIKKFDTNSNGKIEREEAKTENSFNTDFSRMDRNGDEIVVLKELKKHLAKINK